MFVLVGGSVLDEPGSGTRTACPILLLCLLDLKHHEMFQQLPHLLFCKKGNQIEKLSFDSSHCNMIHVEHSSMNTKQETEA